jgi:oxepin-CoA hydrolase/3-oxo-5,6-dehydrosuberyl-CoA semialdehyde dehydrogenase
VPRARLADVVSDLGERLAAVQVGNPRHDSVGMGSLLTAVQLQSVRSGIERLAAQPATDVVQGGVKPLPALSPGYFVAPTLLRCQQPHQADAVHQHEVFGPVATVMPYDGSADLCALVRRGGGGLVASLYTDDRQLVPEVVLGIGAAHGRIFLGSSRLSGQSPGPGTVLPQLNHGGPGHAGDGHELGGARGLEFYMQRCAVVGYKPTVEALLPKRP